MTYLLSIIRTVRNGFVNVLIGLHQQFACLLMFGGYPVIPIFNVQHYEFPQAKFALQTYRNDAPKRFVRSFTDLKI